jgi:L-rhamnose isomerase
MMPTSKHIEAAYALAQANYAEINVDTNRALDTLSRVALSLHCWRAMT